MKKFLLSVFALLVAATAFPADNYQLTNANFEDWSGAAFDGEAQPKGWNASHVEQVGMKFNFAHKETGRNGGFCLMVQDQEVGALGITEVSPGYFSIGKPWAYLPSIAAINQATAGTSGGQAWTHRPDTMSVWIKRTGNNWDKEDFYLLYYAWVKEAKGTSYKGKNGSCTSHEEINEESDVRITMNGNECKTTVPGEQVCEGMWRERATYGQWTNIRVPIYYLNDNAPKFMNVIFSASNYPNFRANNGLYVGNSLYVDDVELIYSSKIQTLRVGGKEWKGFDPNTQEVQIYSVPEGTTSVPDIVAFRGAGSLTNAKGTTKAFPGRQLSGSEITVTKGDLKNTPTVITVKSEDGKSTTVYKIQFMTAKSSNAKLANIYYTYTDADNQSQRVAVAAFNPNNYNYKVELPYGAKGKPVVEAEKQEDEQIVSITQPASLTDKATIAVTAANGTSKATYTLTFEAGKLADNTLKDIKVNGKSVPGFTPTQTIYKVSLPTNTTKMPTVEAVSAYPKGEQTITYNAPEVIDGGTYTVSVTTPGNTVAKIYRLNFKLEASSYSFLKDLKVGNYITDFDPENTTYYVNLPLGTSSLPAITWEKGDEYQTVVKTDLPDGTVDGTVRVTVTAGNGDQTIYKIVFSAEKSEISTLAGIKIGGVALADFKADVTSYDYQLPVGTTTLPVIEPIASDEFQTIVVTTAGVNGKTRISVTAGNGNMTNYYINFSVATYSDNTLANLKVEGYEIDFAPEKTEYFVNLKKGTTKLPNITYTLQNPDFQTATERTFSGVTGDYKVTVRPQNGASQTYVIHFTVATSSNTDLKMIYLDGKPLEGFSSDKLEYTHNLPEGVSKIPTVTFDKAEDTQRVLSVLENKVQTITVTAQSGAKREYKITFVVTVSKNAFLDMIYLDGKPLAGFKKEQLDYTVILEKATCPAITVKKAAGQQVTITAPYAAGKAYIKVKPEDGEANTYTIDFQAGAAATVRLKNILVNKVSLAGFDPAVLNYKATYEKDFPAVEGVKDNNSQTVKVNWKDSVAWIFVQDTLGNQASYSIEFTRKLRNNNALEAIYADGKLISGFKATTYDYSFELAPGSDYPVISYKEKDNSQVVFFGQVEDGKWAIIVLAEDGTPATYTVKYTVKPYNDATLKNLAVDGGYTLTPAFNSTTFDYTVTIDEGAQLPNLSVETRIGQTVMQLDASQTLQQVIVFAQSGESKTYSINYARVKSSNALLADILIDGVSLDGFAPTKTDYIDTLPSLTPVVPNVFPIAQLPNQVITTCFSKPNGTTKIHVEAQDGTTMDYFIKFPTRRSKNANLGDLYLDSEEAEISFSPDQTEYEVILPYSAMECPKVIYEKAENEQRIDVISRPLGQKTEITVTAANGNSKTYTIWFKREVLKTRNLLTMIRVVELEQELSLKDKDQRNFEVPMPFGSRTFTIEYNKSYAAQTVFVQPGGVNHPTIITVKANNGDIADEVYTITPVVPKEDPAVLTDIQVNGVTIDGFNPEQFSYIVPVTEKPKLRYILGKGADINITSQTSKHWQAEVTFGEEGNVRTNVYDVWYYYVNDVVPNMDFKEWVNASTTTSAKKPKGWNVLADFAPSYTYFGFKFTPGEEVQQDGSNSVAYLLTQYNSAPLAGYVPGYITLGDIEYHYQRFGSSAFSIGGGIKFRNTPDEMSFRFKNDKVNNNSRILYTLNGSGGEKTLLHEEGVTSGYVTRTMNLKDANAVAEDPTQLNITFNSFDSESGKNGTAGGEAKMYVDWLNFSFNHTLTSMQVDDFTAEKTDNNFAVTLEDPERIEKPVLAFTGEVADQAQLITWNAPTKDADFEIRTASIRNFAENGTDYTDYTLTVKRPLDTQNKLKDLLLDGVQITGFAAEKVNYSVVLPATRITLPDIQPVPASSLQTVTTKYNATDSIMTITVKPEKGANTVYKVKISTNWSDDTTLANITAEGMTYDPAVHVYEITASVMPLISFDKKSDLQTVTLKNGVITVKSETGGTGTYTIKCVEPAPVTSGKMKEFTCGINVLKDLGGNKTDKTEAKPEEYVSFEREFNTDSVVFVQDEEKMQWQVYGTNNVTYTWNYPTALSANTNLADILIGGVSLEDFQQAELNYLVVSDTTLVVEPVSAEERQVVNTTVAPVAGGSVYTVTVTAANGIATKAYSVTVRRSMSDIATLEDILIDGVSLEDFDPEQLNYTVILPTPAIKMEQPKMPNITYVAGQKGQTVIVKPGERNGDPTTFEVTSEDGTQKRFYELTVNAEPSHCSDLTGITVNGVSMDHFEPGRHHYSVVLQTSKIGIDYTSDDRFQHVDTIVNVVSVDHEYHYTLRVTAEDGTSSDYTVEIYVENQSNDAQLANITLNGKKFEDFERSLNSDLIFDSGNNNYEIYLPSGTTVLPEVNAQLKMTGQSVVITQKQESVLLDVTAVDGVTHNVYTLHFLVPLSKNADLSMIFLNGEELADFDPSYYFYQIELPVGVHTMPEVAAQKGEASQTLKPIEIDNNKMQATIRVQAEDPSVKENTYVVLFRLTQSDADKLKMIYQDGQPLEGFKQSTLYYALSLPVGTTAFPELSWQEEDEWQTINMETVESTPNTLVRQIYVTSESGKKTIYTVAYTIEKSAVDTLQMIFVDQKQLQGFAPQTNDYSLMLTAAYANELGGKMPMVEYISGDSYQTVMVAQMPEDQLSGKSLGYKTVITVTAQTGKTRIYTIHYPVELSTEATLNMIMLGGKTLPNFDAERFNYKVDIEKEASIPVVSVIKKEDVQTYEIQVLEDVVHIKVTAEDVNFSHTYTLTFERQKSNVTTLRDIVLTDAKGVVFPSYEFPYRPEVYSYTVNLKYDGNKSLDSQLPKITPVFYDPEQKADTMKFNLPNGDIQVDITVTAANGEDQAVYSIVFHFVKSSDATLQSLLLNGVELEGFDPSQMEYTYAHPYGTKPEAYFGQDAVTYVLNDQTATVAVSTDENGVIHVVVTAQDGVTILTYLISQMTAVDGDNALAWITIDGDTIRDFDPEVTFYTYYVEKGASVPTIDAGARSPLAEVDLGRVVVGDTCTIICTAVDGSTRYYYVAFTISDSNSGAVASSGDVLLKRVGGTYQLLAATVRKGVTIALYDQYGHLVFYDRVPVANPNDADIVVGYDNLEYLNNVVDNRSGLLIDVIPGQPYFFCFFADEKTKLYSGKIMAY